MRTEKEIRKLFEDNLKAYMDMKRRPGPERDYLDGYTDALEWVLEDSEDIDANKI